MQFTAEARQINVSPRKVRLVADSIKKMALEDALTSLSFIRKRAAYPLRKTLESAVSNAVNNGKVEKNTLSIFSIDVFDGPAYKRFRPSTRGRIHPYKKRTSHIKIVLAQKENTPVKKEKTEKKEVTKEKDSK